jgi:hypothetical protein
MKVKADITIDINEADLEEAGQDIGETLISCLTREVEKAITESEVWRDLKRAVYHACLDKLREEVAKEFIDKIKGE